MTYSEKVEIVYRYFTISLDIDIAIQRIELTEKEREKILKDEILRARIDNHLASIQEDIMDGLMDLKTSNNESIRLRAILELGKILYQKRFNPNKDNDDQKRLQMVPDKIILTGSEE